MSEASIALACNRESIKWKLPVSNRDLAVRKKILNHFRKEMGYFGAIIIPTSRNPGDRN